MATKNVKNAKESKETPIHPQTTNFIMVEYTTNGPDEMQFPRAMSYKTSGNEKAAMGRKQPF